MKQQDKFIALCIIYALITWIPSIAYSSDVVVLATDSLDAEFQHLKSENTVKCALWKDAEGLHYVALVIKTVGIFGEKDYSSTLTAYALNLNQNKQWIESWRIRDYAPNALSGISYTNNTFRIEDLDSNGIAEVSFMYTIYSDGCESFISKLLMHIGKQKIAIRGRIPKEMAYLDDYEKNVDSLFNKYDAKIKDHASCLWDYGVYLTVKSILEKEAMMRIIKSFDFECVN